MSTSDDDLGTVGDLVAEVRRGFLASAPARIATLEAALARWATGDDDGAWTVLQVAHALRGTAGTLGLTEVSELAAELEDLVKRGDAGGPSRAALLVAGISRNLAAAAADRGSAPTRTARRLVMLVHPDGPLREELGHALEAAGFDVMAVAHDTEAAAALQMDLDLERVVLAPQADHRRLVIRLRQTLGAPLLVVQLRSAGEPTGGRGAWDVELRAGDDLAALATAIADVPTAPAARPRILVLDDDPEVLAATLPVLEARGAAVATHRGSDRALEAVAAFEPDLVLIDVVMAGLDGFGVMAALRAEPRWHNIAVVIMTGRKEVQSRIRAYELGADDYLHKPVHPDELGTRVMARLRGRSLIRAALERDLETGLPGRHGFVRSLTRLLATGSATAVGIARVRRAGASLERLGQELLPRIRPHDPLARWDGRSLALALAGASARELAELLSAAISAAQPDGFSVGVADTVDAPGATAAGLLLAAEAPLDEERNAATAVLPVRGRAPRALVADDDELLRTLVARLLDRDGVRVDQAKDGEEALALIEGAAKAGTPYDILVLDIHMPRRTGLEVLRALAGRAATPPAIVLSAQSRDADVERALDAGAVDFMAKPFSAARLVARIRRLLAPVSG